MSTNQTTAAPTSNIPDPTSTLPHPTSLPDKDRARLTILYRARGDATSLISLCGEDNPLDLLAWLNEPHIKPWHQAILAAHNQHLHTDTQLSLARALKDITRILVLEADSTLRIRAVNNIIRLANAIHRAGSLPAAGRAGVGSATSLAASATRASDSSHQSHTSHESHPSHGAAKELHFAQERVEDSKSSLSLHLDRRARNKTDLEDATAPVGTFPSWARDLAPPAPPAAQARDQHLNGHASIQKAGSPRPPSPKRRKRR